VNLRIGFDCSALNNLLRDEESNEVNLGRLPLSVVNVLWNQALTKTGHSQASDLPDDAEVA